MLVAPKNLKYHQDGSGRDQYIYMDNGGYYPRIRQTILLKDPGTFTPSPRKRGLTISCFERPKKYYNNGTGRDSYIFYDDGGYCPGYTKSHYLKSLRSTTLSPIKHRKTYSSKHDILASIVMKKSQQMNSTRLSKPISRTIDFSENPQDYSSANYEMRQTTKWKTAFESGFSKKDLFRLVKGKTARH